MIAYTGRMGMSATARRLASLGLALLAFGLLTAAAVTIFRGMAERNRLESRNEGERVMNLLLSSLRDHDSFGSAIESIEALRDEVIGVGAYTEVGELLYAWGRVPSTMPAELKPSGIGGVRDRLRQYRENPRRDSLILVLHRPPKPTSPPPSLPEGGAGPAGRDGGPSSFLLDTMRRADIVYLEVRQPEFWRRTRRQAVLFPVTVGLLAGLVLSVRFLVLRNLDYRRRIEEQKNLVAMGTAASTLAHEIKNPLLSIRLQTGIIERTCGAAAEREITIINREVDRLSMLTHHVNDFLRDPAGRLQAVDPAQVGQEVLGRLCAPLVPEVRTDGSRIFIDPERLRSVLENLVRNALESKGDPAGVGIEISRQGVIVRIDVLDRGRGIPPSDRPRLFDPFFTTKSRGTGIGLAICRRFVEAARGRLTLEDRPGGGTRARIELPEAEV